MADDEVRRSSSSTPISIIVFVIAMEDEALPIIRRFDLVKDASGFPEGVPWIRYHGSYKDLQLNVVWPGKDPVLGVNNVGTVPAALATYASIQVLKPDLIINAGTAGGFTAFSTPALSSSLRLKAGVLSTGDSFDMCERDQALAEANNATLVDMEGAAVAYVTSLLSVPVIFLKVVSNPVDGGKPSGDEFLSNLASVTAVLGDTVGRVVDFICGKRLGEL